MTSRRRVVVSGLGSVTACGPGVEALWSAARDGVSGVKPIGFAEIESQRIGTAAHIPDFQVDAFFPPNLSRMIDRFAAYAMVAADEAVTHAKLKLDEPLGERCGVVIGSGMGGASTTTAGFLNFYVGKSRPDAFAVPKIMTNAAASQVSMRFRATGPCLCVSTACSSGTQAIGLGAHLIRSGLIDTAIVGGSEALLTACIFNTWEVLRVMSPTLCRPFSLGRNGMILGEGAAVIVLEELGAAEKRGAPILAELTGFGTTSDGGDLLRPDPDGAARAMAMAIDDAGLEPSAIDYVNAHGTGTIANDLAEADALHRVFGHSLPGIAVSSTKPIHGHALGAAGAIEFVVTVKAIQDQIAPPTLNFNAADPKCVLNAVPNVAQPRAIRAALSNSFAFGGINATLLVQPFA